MDKYEKKLLKITDQIIKKWRKILKVDEIWKIKTEITDCAEMSDALARVNIGSAEYYTASVEIASCFLDAPEEIFTEIMNDVISHELLHLIGAAYARFAQTIAGKNEGFQKELRFQFERIVTRLQQAFVEINNQLDKKDETIGYMREYFMSEKNKNCAKVRILEDKIKELEGKIKDQQRKEKPLKIVKDPPKSEN